CSRWGRTRTTRRRTTTPSGPGPERTARSSGTRRRPAGAADYKAAPVVHRFKTLKEYSEATGQEKHSVLVDYDVFAHVTMPDKTDPQRLYKPDGLDFRLTPGSPAIDAGVELPSITDGFTGRAPDIGAYETGRPVPQYGPRN